MDSERDEAKIAKLDSFTERAWRDDFDVLASGPHDDWETWEWARRTNFALDTLAEARQWNELVQANRDEQARYADEQEQRAEQAEARVVEMQSILDTLGDERDTLVLRIERLETGLLEAAHGRHSNGHHGGAFNTCTFYSCVDARALLVSDEAQGEEQRCKNCDRPIWLNAPSGEWFHKATAELYCHDSGRNTLRAAPAQPPEAP